MKPKPIGHDRTLARKSQASCMPFERQLRHNAVQLSQTSESSPS